PGTAEHAESAERFQEWECFFWAFSVILAVKTLAARNNRRARRRRRAVSTMEVLFWAFSAILAVKTLAARDRRAGRERRAVSRMGVFFSGVLCDLGGKNPFSRCSLRSRR